MVCDPISGFAFIADKAGMIKLYDLNVVSSRQIFLTLEEPSKVETDPGHVN